MAVLYFEHSGQIVKANKIVATKSSFFALQGQLSKVLTEDLAEALGRKDLTVTLTGRHGRRRVPRDSHGDTA